MIWEVFSSLNDSTILWIWQLQFSKWLWSERIPSPSHPWCGSMCHQSTGLWRRGFRYRGNVSPVWWGHEGALLKHPLQIQAFTRSHSFACQQQAASWKKLPGCRAARAEVAAFPWGKVVQSRWCIWSLSWRWVSNLLSLRIIDWDPAPLHSPKCSLPPSSSLPPKVQWVTHQGADGEVGTSWLGVWLFLILRMCIFMKKKVHFQVNNRLTVQK